MCPTHVRHTSSYKGVNVYYSASRDSSVGKVTRLRVDQPMNRGYKIIFSWEWGGRGVKLTNHLHRVHAKNWLSYTSTPPHNFNACTKGILPITFFIYSFSLYFFHLFSFLSFSLSFFLSFLLSFIHSFSSILSFSPYVIYLFFHLSFNHSFFLSFIQSFIFSFFHSFILFHSFFLSLCQSFIHSFFLSFFLCCRFET
jgi:hypothetical protein